MKSIADRVVTVTGAAGGIGEATAVAFASAGADVMCVDIDAEGVVATARRIETAGSDGRVASAEVDVSEPEAVDALAHRVVDEFGGADVIVNNAGINVTGDFEEHSLDDFKRTFDVNLWGVIHGCRSFLPFLRESDAGRIVNISSAFGIVGVAGQSAYSASKFAVRGLSESLHEELADSSVGVSVVYPGCIDTNIVRDATIYDTDAADEIRDYFAEQGCPPEVVAKCIVDAVQQGDHRVLVTPEAYLMDLARRIAPTAGNRLANRLMSQFLGMGDTEQ